MIYSKGEKTKRNEIQRKWEKSSQDTHAIYSRKENGGARKFKSRKCSFHSF